MLQLNPRRKVYDVCIIGSGAGGGTAAKVLTEGGLNVVMLEAGPRLNPDKDFKEHVWPYQLPHRGVGVGGKQSGIGNEFMAPNGFWEIEGEPYTTAPGSSFRWFRSRIEGGRTNHWGRIALRFGPADFRAHSTDGMGDDWPITYEELAPYYDKVESYIGVFGSKENIPNSPDGMFMPPPKPRCTDTYVYDKLGTSDQADRERTAARRVFGLLPEPLATDLYQAWEEFEARVTPEARFARAIDRLQPLLHNYYTGGLSWKQHGISAAQVRRVMSVIADASSPLGALAAAIIDDSVDRGFLPETIG